MRIIKLKGKTEAAIMQQIERDYKDKAFVLNTQKEEATGFFKWLKSPHFVVTVAIKEEEEHESQPLEREKQSYDVLMELKKQIGELHAEIGELKQLPIAHEAQTDSENIKEHTMLDHIKEKLEDQGISPQVCENLLTGIASEDSETMIRDLYNGLENSLIEKEEEESVPQILFFIGSTGVGKTTTLAKLTAKYVLEEQKKVVLFTSDTYRIAAVEQLKTYADILGVAIEIIYDEKELPQYIEKWKHMDHILIDTAGRSHKNTEQVSELKALLEQVEEKQVFLVLNANTSAKDVEKIVLTYEQAAKSFDLILTKTDETDAIGNIVNINVAAQYPIAYLTNGQNVPSDILRFHKQDYINELLGRLNDE